MLHEIKFELFFSNSVILNGGEQSFLSSVTTTTTNMVYTQDSANAKKIKQRPHNTHNGTKISPLDVHYSS